MRQTKDWLKEALKDGPGTVTELFKRMADRGWKTDNPAPASLLMRNLQELQKSGVVVSESNGFASKWHFTWSLKAG